MSQDSHDAYGDHDMVEEVRPEQFGPDEVRNVRWVVCRRCGCELALDERTQRIPDGSCDRELVKGIMRS